MNPALKSFLPRCGLLVVVWLLSLGSLSAQTTTNSLAITNSTPEDRILVIVETSSAMQKRAENVQKLVGEMFSSGLGGDMRSGDTIGMWTFNDELRTGQFALQRWTKAARQRVAVNMVQFLQQQQFEKAARPAVIWSPLTNIVAQSERITLVIVSTGSEPITGTPFDESIAQNFLKNAEAQRKAKMPFVTILRAYHGKFVSFSVNLPPWPMELPDYPKVARRAPEPAVAKPEPVVTNPSPAPAKAVVDYNPIYATNVPVVEPMPVVVAEVVSNTPEPTVSHTNEVATTKPEMTLQPPTQNGGVTSPAATERQKSPLPVVTILVAGIALLVGIMVVFIALLRWTRQTSGESLITRTMNKHDQ